MGTVQRRRVAVRLTVVISVAAAVGVVIAVAGWQQRGHGGLSEDRPPADSDPVPATTAPIALELPSASSAAVAPSPTTTIKAARSTARTSLDSTVDEPFEVSPEQYRVRLGTLDEPGALWVMDAGRYEFSGIEERVLDMCDRADSVSVLLGRDAASDQPLTLSEQERLAQFQWSAGCDLPEPNPDRSARYVGWSMRRGALSIHATHEDAAAELREHKEVRRARTSTLPLYAGGLGSVTISSGKGRGFEYSDALSPVDEVQLIASSIDLSDGVLRGMVRNRSRTLFAYGTTVTALGQSWRWPLSIQPGELAPFEIEDWTGPVDPDSIEITVAAEMSPDVDRSRAFYFFHRFQVAPYLYPPEVTAELEAGDCRAPADNGRHFAANIAISKYYGLDSHPSFFRHIDNLAIADVRAYVAFYDDSTYRVHDLRRLHVLFPVFYEDADYDDPDFAEYRIVTDLPQPDPDPEATSALYDAHMAFCNNHNSLTDGYTVWIGGAH